jgi:alpha-amylase
MIAFRHAVAGSGQTNWWDNGINAIAFSRGNLGFVVINGETSTAISRVFTTGLVAGKYCDVLAGGVNIAVSPNTCAGKTITVDASGNAGISLAALTGLVLQAGVTVP